MKQRKREDGFTLIELMIVIAVIGILAVVMVPKFGGVKDSAKTTGVITNVRSVESYVNANIDKWVNKGTEDHKIAAEIAAAFAPVDNAVKNPYSGMTNIVDRFNPSTPEVLPAPTDGIQILTTPTPADGYGDGHGTVVVYIPTSPAAGIEITGYDNKGYKINTTITVKP